MKAIKTKYVPATDTKPARISASAEGGFRIVISSDSEGTQEQAHAKAAVALCRKMGWTGELVAGGFADCYVFCFAAAGRYAINGEPQAQAAAATPVRCIVQVYTSERDTNGNCYHFARFTNPAKGRNASVTVEVGGRANADVMGRRLAGGDWEATFCTEQTMGKRDWQYARKHSDGGVSYEGSAATNAALCALFDVAPTTLDR